MTMFDDAIEATNARALAAHGLPADPDMVNLTFDVGGQDFSYIVGVCRRLLNGVVFDLEELDLALEAFADLAGRQHADTHALTCAEDIATRQVASVQMFAAGVLYERMRLEAKR